MTQGPDFTNPTVTQRRVVYDTDNMPIQVWAQQSGVTTYFSYDGDGGRVKKTTTGGATVYYVGDHYEVKDNESLKYIFAGNLRLIMIKGANTFYYHKDHLGSTSVMTDNNGTVVETAQYEPFGATREHTGQDMSAYKFTDQELDNETNLYNYDARLYDPVIGRFGSPDSIWNQFEIEKLKSSQNNNPNQDYYNPQNLNVYSYCMNNPINAVDPDGKRTYFLNGIGNETFSAPEYASKFANRLEYRGVHDVRIIGIFTNEQGVKGVMEGISYVAKEMLNINVYSKQLANMIKNDLKDCPLEEGEQLNLIGYSGAGQIVLNAAEHLEGTKAVDNVVLIGSPAYEENVKNIKKVTSLLGGYDPLGWTFGPGIHIRYTGWNGHRGYFTKGNIEHVTKIVVEEMKKNKD